MSVRGQTGLSDLSFCGVHHFAERLLGHAAFDRDVAAEYREASEVEDLAGLHHALPTPPPYPSRNPEAQLRRDQHALEPGAVAGCSGGGFVEGTAWREPAIDAAPVARGDDGRELARRQHIGDRLARRRSLAVFAARDDGGQSRRDANLVARLDRIGKLLPRPPEDVPPTRQVEGIKARHRPADGEASAGHDVARAFAPRHRPRPAVEIGETGAEAEVARRQANRGELREK